MACQTCLSLKVIYWYCCVICNISKAVKVSSTGSVPAVVVSPRKQPSLPSKDVHVGCYWGALLQDGVLWAPNNLSLSKLQDWKRKLSAKNTNRTPNIQLGRPILENIVSVDRFDTSVADLVMEKQYLSLSTKTPTTNVYGLGENLHRYFKHQFAKAETWAMFARDQPPGQDDTQVRESLPPPLSLRPIA